MNEQRTDITDIDDSTDQEPTADLSMKEIIAEMILSRMRWESFHLTSMQKTYLIDVWGEISKNILDSIEDKDD